MAEKQLPRAVEQVRLLEMLKAQWFAHPHLRLCQLLGNVAIAGHDLYYMSDEHLYGLLKEYTSDTLG